MSQKEKGLMDVDYSVVIVVGGEEGVKGLIGNGEKYNKNEKKP